jgi:deoxyadenosine/deoxycytidine kinase
VRSDEDSLFRATPFPLIETAVQQDTRYIAIEGPIGAGKTTLARLLSERLEARLVLEPSDSNPFLERFYADPRRYALATQLTFLVERWRQQADLAQHDLFARAVVSDYVLAKDRIFATLTLNEEELELYDAVYAAMASRAARPDVIVRLEADETTLLRRIERRGIACERAIRRDYLARLNRAYDAYFRTYRGRLVILNTGGLDYAKDALNVDAVLSAIDETRAGTSRVRIGEQEGLP